MANFTIWTMVGILCIVQQCLGEKPTWWQFWITYFVLMANLINGLL